jgi:hemerythrin
MFVAEQNTLNKADRVANHSELFQTLSVIDILIDDRQRSAVYLAMLKFALQLHAHFIAEEVSMVKCRFPAVQISHHRKSHYDIVLQHRELTVKCGVERVISVDEVNELRWALMVHEQEYDAKFEAYLLQIRKATQNG